MDEGGSTHYPRSCCLEGEVGEARVRHHNSYLLVRHANPHLRAEESRQGRGGEELLGVRAQHSIEQGYLGHQVYP